LGNALYWVENHVYERDELAVRFHHKLVWIHPFPNGNGRLSRMMGDLLVEALEGERFSWRAALASEDPAAARRAYRRFAGGRRRRQHTHHCFGA
jgi:fido (protein-threonine AMPylation protein)